MTYAEYIGITDKDLAPLKRLSRHLRRIRKSLIRLEARKAWKNGRIGNLL